MTPRGVDGPGRERTRGVRVEPGDQRVGERVERPRRVTGPQALPLVVDRLAGDRHERLVLPLPHSRPNGGKQPLDAGRPRVVRAHRGSRQPCAGSQPPEHRPGPPERLVQEGRLQAVGDPEVVLDAEGGAGRHEDVRLAAQRVGDLHARQVEVVADEAERGRGGRDDREEVGVRVDPAGQPAVPGADVAAGPREQPLPRRPARARARRGASRAPPWRSWRTRGAARSPRRSPAGRRSSRAGGPAGRTPSTGCRH